MEITRKSIMIKFPLRFVKRRNLLSLAYMAMLFLLVSFMLSGCTKETEESYMNLNSNLIIQRSYPNLTPENIDGILKFRDNNHLNDYYILIDSLASFAGDRDSVLQEIENSLRFKSARSLIPTEISDISEISINSVNFLADDVLLSILNQYNEFEIGDSTYVFQNTDEVYKVLSTDRSVISHLRSIPKGELLPDSLFSENVTLKSSEKTNRKVDFIGYRSDTCYSVVSSKKHYSNCLDVFIGMVEVYKVVNGLARVNVTIDWGDGTIEFFDITFKREFYHNYLTPGDYNIVVYVYDWCEEWPGVGYHHYNTFRFKKECFGDRKDKSGSTSKEFNNIKLTMKYYIWTVTDIIGTWAGARVELWESISAGKLKKVRGKLSVEINSNFRNGDCELKEAKRQPDSCKSCRSETAKVRSKRANRYHIEDDVWARYSAEKYGISLSKTYVLKYGCY